MSTLKIKARQAKRYIVAEVLSILHIFVAIGVLEYAYTVALTYFLLGIGYVFVSIFAARWIYRRKNKLLWEVQLLEAKQF